MSQLIATLHHGRKVWRQGSTATLRRVLMLVAGGSGALLLAVAATGASPALSQGVMASTLAGLATGVGAVAAFGLGRLTVRGHDALLGAAAGVMLAAAFFSLLLPALDNARPLLGSEPGGAVFVALALALGALAMGILERFTPHAHESGRLPRDTAARQEGMWLVAAAIALHNLPEGFSVGASYGAGSALGLSTALGIGLQNIPEGLVVAAAMHRLGARPARAALVATLTGMVEPVGALLGGMLAGMASFLLPVALASAAGAMLFVVSHEMVPESHRRGHEGAATTALMGGFLLMFILSHGIR